MEVAAVCIEVPAKINLWLEVLRRRTDGYHDLSTLMVPVGIRDRVEVCLLPKSERIGIECGHPEVPENAGNLAWRAAELYLRNAGSWKTGVHIRLEKSIPVGAGLGGGSANAGAVLLAMNRLSPEPFSLSELHGMARTLGADVPFFLRQRPCLATGIGEKLLEVEGVPDYPVVLIKPPLSVSTRWVYQSLKLTRGESRIRLNRIKENPWNLQSVMVNDLETVTVAEYPLLGHIKAWLSEQGAVGVLMSGSGPTIFGVFRSRGEAREVGLLAEGVWRDCWVAVTEVQGASSTADE